MRVPAVYVYIEDKSLVLPSVEQGRTGLLVVLSDRGPHNRVVEINNIRQFIRLFGKPNFFRTGPAHYLADMFLRYSQKLYIIRASLLDSNNEKSNAAIANRIIKYNDPRGSIQLIYGNFKFTKNSNIVVTDYIGYDLFTIYEYICSETDGLSPYDAKVKSRKIINKLIVEVPDPTPSDPNRTKVEHHLVLDAEYEGTTTNPLIVGDEFEKAYEYYPASKDVEYLEIVSKPDPVLALVTNPIKAKFIPSMTLIDPDGVQLSGDEYYILDEVNGSDIPEVAVFEDVVDYNEVGVGDQIFSSVDSIYYNKRIVAKGSTLDPNTNSTLYYATLENTDMVNGPNGYEGTKTPIGTYSDVYKIVNSQYKFRPRLTVDKFYNPAEGVEDGTYVLCRDLESFEAVAVGTWIFDKSKDETFMRQVVNKEIIIDYNNTLDDASDDVLYYYLILNETYLGSPTDVIDTSGNVIEQKFTFIKKYDPIELEEMINLRKTPSANILYFDGYQDYGQLDTIDDDNIFYFYAIGTGTYYNNIFIKGIRNYEYEFRYLDEDSEPKFKYAFMDVATYVENEDGTITQLEGPWLVSLIEKDDNNDPIIDLNTGERLFICDVYNRRSDFVNIQESIGVSNLIESENAENLRLIIQSFFSQNYVLKTNTLGKNGFYLKNGENGILYDEAKNIRLYNDEIVGSLVRAYNGTLESTDGTIELIVQDVYPWYLFDYIICGGYRPVVQNAARELADRRNDALVLADTGALYITPNEDLNARLNQVPWNTFNAMLYGQYREVFDAWNGKYIWITPVYHAIERHLYVDKQYWISEPVAGIEKGAISEPIKLAYKPSFVKMQDLIEKGVNPTIYEPDGIYILTQLTTYKRLSILQRAHAVKFVHYLKKVIPRLLKDLLQRKASKFWLEQARIRVNGLMETFLDGKAIERYISITEYSANVEFDELRSEMNVYLKIRPIRVIEAINVFIIVS